MVVILCFIFFGHPFDNLFLFKFDFMFKFISMSCYSQPIFTCYLKTIFNLQCSTHHCMIEPSMWWFDRLHPTVSNLTHTLHRNPFPTAAAAGRTSSARLLKSTGPAVSSDRSFETVQTPFLRYSTPPALLQPKYRSPVVIGHFHRHDFHVLVCAPLASGGQRWCVRHWPASVAFLFSAAPSGRLCRSVNDFNRSEQHTAPSHKQCSAQAVVRFLSYLFAYFFFCTFPPAANGCRCVCVRV